LRSGVCGDVRFRHRFEMKCYTAVQQCLADVTLFCMRFADVLMLYDVTRGDAKSATHIVFKPIRKQTTHAIL